MGKAVFLLILVALATVTESRRFYCYTRRHYCNNGRCCVNDRYGINGCTRKITDDCCHRSRHYCRFPYACDNNCGVHCIRYKHDGEVEFEIAEAVLEAEQ